MEIHFLWLLAFDHRHAPVVVLSLLVDRIRESVEEFVRRRLHAGDRRSKFILPRSDLLWSGIRKHLLDVRHLCLNRGQFASGLRTCIGHRRLSGRWRCGTGHAERLLLILGGKGVLLRDILLCPLLWIGDVQRIRQEMADALDRARILVWMVKLSQVTNVVLEIAESFIVPRKRIAFIVLERAELGLIGLQIFDELGNFLLVLLVGQSLLVSAPFLSAL